MIRFAWKPFCTASVLAVLSLGTQGCYVYSAFQGARTLDQRRVSLTPSASIVSFNNEDESNWSTTQFGVRGAAGLGHRLEVQARYERLEGHEEDDGIDGWGYNYVDLGFKVGIIENILAVGMPVGFFFGEKSRGGCARTLYPPASPPTSPMPDENFQVSASSRFRPPFHVAFP